MPTVCVCVCVCFSVTSVGLTFLALGLRRTSKRAAPIKLTGVDLATVADTLGPQPCLPHNCASPVYSTLAPASDGLCPRCSRRRSSSSAPPERRAMTVVPNMNMRNRDGAARRRMEPPKDAANAA